MKLSEIAEMLEKVEDMKVNKSAPKHNEEYMHWKRISDELRQILFARIRN